MTASNAHAQRRRAIALLREAAQCIRDELNACGEDEVRDHPMLAAHARVYARINRYLDRIYKEGDT